MKRSLVLLLLLLNVIVVKASILDSTAVESKSQDPVIQRWLEAFIDFATINHPNYSLSMYPVAGYEPQAGFIFGIKPLWTLYGVGGKSTTIATEFSYSTEGFVNAEANLNGFTNSNWSIESSVAYYRKENQWYGVGVSGEAIDYSMFDSNEFLFSGAISKGFGKVYVGLLYDIQTMAISSIEGDLFTPDVPGYEGGFILGIGPMIRFDGRDNVVYPHHGLYVDLRSLHYASWMGSDYEFSTLALDIRYFNTFGLPQKHVFAFQSVFKNSSDNTPFYRMPVLADKNTLRGISNPNKYIDNNMWYSQVEYRRDLWWRLGAVAWVGVGNDYSNEHSAFFEDVKYVYGIGGRFQIDDKEKVHLRADFGFGPYGDSAIFLTFLEAF
ncbi:hypothetical protein K4L44_10100 [Halosquirtibacter laminarini]|uniref:Uncharacterized protein n=1 Tax=Halosquirtibacter laminarini TaxID=3374600 RepID=A0AC61NBU8_9BACT|nr:hypothetical protein K4L44_10100 [Prolixibacteraceae bacterium]